MRSFRKTAFHNTAVAQKNAVLAEELADFREGDHVMTVDGFPGRVTGVLFGPYQGTESYQVELDGGLGGGDYLPGQLASIRATTSSRVEAAEITASIPIEAVTDHLANVDYPELEDVLERRLPNENIQVYAAVNQDDQASRPDSSTDDTGETLDQDQQVAEDNPDDVPDSNSDDPDQEVDEEAPQAELGDVTPPSACSFCGNASFSDPQMTGRGVRVRCDQCGGTMKSWGGQWEPEFPNSSQNHASEQGDWSQGGAAGVANAPGANFKTTMLEVTSGMSRPEIAESLQSEAGIIQYLFNRMYEKARKKYEDSQVEWWRPPVNEIGSDLEGPAQYHLVTPKQVTVGSLSEYDDPDWRWHFTASWLDVQAKARRIRKENHVKIVAASKTFVTAEVLGDQATYETQLNYVPGTRKVADWSCGCKWASYAWGRSKRYQRFEGRLCSHALATQYEASSRGIFGREVEPDRVRPDWQNASSPIVVQYDKAKGRDLTRRAHPPANMRRTFSSLVLDSDGIYPVPQRLDLQHPPVYASVQTMLDHDADLVDVIEMLASVGVEQEQARGLVIEAILSASTSERYLGHSEDPESGSAFESEASKQHHRHKPTVYQDHGITWGRGYFGLGWCGLCGGAGCGHCNGTGQVPQSDPNAVGSGGSVDAGAGSDSGASSGAGSAGGDGGAVGGGGATSVSRYDAFDYGHEMGYDYADRLNAHGEGMSDLHPGSYPEEREYHANSWFDQRHRDHVRDGFDHGYTSWQNEQEAGLPHRGGSIKTAMPWHTAPGEEEHAAQAKSVRHAGFKGYVGSGDMYGDGDDEEHGFDEDLYDRVTPEPTPEEHAHYEQHGEYPDSHYERHDQAYQDALTEKAAESEPDHDDEHLHHFIGEHGTDAHEWTRHEAQPQRIDLRNGVYATQSHVSQKHIDKYLADPNATTHRNNSRSQYLGDKAPMFVTHNGELHATEGHHRIAAALQRGDSHIDGWHYNLDKHPVATHPGRTMGMSDESKSRTPCEDCQYLSGEDDQQHVASRRVRADYSTADPLAGMDAGQLTRPTVPHSHSKNPASTGWATSQDPGDWGKSLISNDFGVTFDSSLHVTPSLASHHQTDTKAFDAALHEAGGRHHFMNPSQVQFSYETGLSHGYNWAAQAGQHANFEDAANEHAEYHEYQNPGMKYHYLDGFKDGAAQRNEQYPSQHAFGALDAMSDAAADIQSRIFDATLHEEPEAALPYTDGAQEDVDADPGAGNTSGGPFDGAFENDSGNIPGVDRYNTMSTVGGLTEEQKIIAEFQMTAGAQSLRKESMKDFSFEEQQELINEGKGARARNFNDLRIAGTHYELIGDGDEDETILWV